MVHGNLLNHIILIIKQQEVKFFKLGIAYYISPVENWFELKEDPIRFFTYMIFLCLCCGYFSNFYSKLSGRSAEDVAKMLKKNNRYIIGYPG